MEKYLSTVFENLSLRDAFAVDTPIWMLGDSAYDILNWHDHLLPQGSCQSLRITRETLTAGFVETLFFRDLFT